MIMKITPEETPTMRRDHPQLLPTKEEGIGPPQYVSFSHTHHNRCSCCVIVRRKLGNRIRTHVDIGVSVGTLLSISRPRFIGGMSRLSRRSFCSTHPRSRTRPRIFASFIHSSDSKMASLTFAATFRRNAGSINSARGGAKLSGAKHRSAMVLSRSWRKAGFSGARGAKWVVANSRTGPMSPSGEAVQVLINSINSRRSSEKCSEGLVSSN